MAALAYPKYGSEMRNGSIEFGADTDRRRVRGSRSPEAQTDVRRYVENIAAWLAAGRWRAGTV